MPHILRIARSIMHLLSPMTGDLATGNLFVKATGGDVVVPKNSYAIPIIPGAGTAKQLSPHVLVKTTAETTVTAAGVAVPCKTVLGGIGGNLAAGTDVRWSPTLEGVEPVSVVDAGGMTGGAEATGYGGVKQIRFYEQLVSGKAADDIFRAYVGRFPAILLLWSGTRQDTDKRPGRDRGGFLERWTLGIISSRMDGDDERRTEGLHIMEEAREWLIGMQQVDGDPVTSSTSLEILQCDRLSTSDTSYIYTISFQTTAVICRRERRTFPDWITFRLDHDTQSGIAPEVPIVDGAEYTMP